MTYSGSKLAIYKKGYVISYSGGEDYITIPDFYFVEPPPPPTLGGSVSITGNGRVGATLTADISAVTGNAGTPTYVWERSSTVIGGNSSTYTLTEDDLGYPTISVTLTYSGSEGSVLGYFTDQVKPALMPPATVWMSAAGQPWNILSWSFADDATSYIVYRSDSEESGYDQIGEPTGTSYTDYSAVFGSTYYYKVSKKYNSEESDMSASVQKTTGEGVPVLTLNADYNAYKSIGPNTFVQTNQTDWYAVDVTSGTNLYVHANLQSGLHNTNVWKVLIDAIDKDGTPLDNYEFFAAANRSVHVTTSYNGKVYIKIYTTVTNWGSVGSDSDSYRIKFSTSSSP